MQSSLLLHCFVIPAMMARLLYKPAPYILLQNMLLSSLYLYINNFARVERIELSTFGFGDQRSTN